MDFDMENTRRDLTAKARKFGTNTPDGHACFNLIQLLKNRANALPGSYEIQHFPSLIAEQMKRFEV